MISWILTVTVFVGGEVFLYQEFPMASEEECRSEIEWPGNAVHFLMKSGDGFEVKCVSKYKDGIIST